MAVAERPTFPKTWGEEPTIGTMDYRVLPGGYGHGSSTLATWIEERMKDDQKQRRGAHAHDWRIALTVASQPMRIPLLITLATSHVCSPISTGLWRAPRHANSRHAAAAFRVRRRLRNARQVADGEGVASIPRDTSGIRRRVSTPRGVSVHATMRATCERHGNRSHGRGAVLVSPDGPFTRSVDRT